MKRLATTLWLFLQLFCIVSWSSCRSKKFRIHFYRVVFLYFFLHIPVPGSTAPPLLRILLGLCIANNTEDLGLDLSCRMSRTGRSVMCECCNKSLALAYCFSSCYDITATLWCVFFTNDSEQISCHLSKLSMLLLICRNRSGSFSAIMRGRKTIRNTSFQTSRDIC